MNERLPSTVGTPSQSSALASSANPVERQGRALLHQRVRTTPVAWLGHAQLTRTEWEEYGTRLGAVSKSTNWWLGDWLRFGQRHYNDHRYEFGSQITGYDEQTLMNFAYVASRFEISRRREMLSWSHHAELAAFDHAEQDQWLDAATAGHLSVRDLRSRLRRARKATPDKPKVSSSSLVVSEATESLGDLTIVCPDCGHEITVRRGQFPQA